MMKNEVIVTKKYNRCLAFTLPNGKTIEVKCLGEKEVAAKDASDLLAAFTAAEAVVVGN